MESNQNPPESRSPKKVYSSPHLKTYGDMREITRELSIDGALDGGLNVGLVKTGSILP